MPRMRWLFIIDRIEGLNPKTDTTLAIMDDALLRGIEVFYCTLNEIYIDGQVRSNCHQYKKEFMTERSFEEFDLVFMRKEPPYDLDFHYATQILSLTKTKVVNSPQALRDFNEKLIIMNFPELIPKTIVTSKLNNLVKFVIQNGNVGILKSLDSYQGKSVVRIQPGSIALIKKYTKDGKAPIMVQEFLPGVVDGDKRILLLGGEFLGAVARIPKTGGYISNFGAGGRAKRTDLTEKDRTIIKKIAPFLRKNGLHFVGIDVIDRYLTEINITCPTGIVQINHVEKMKIEKKVVDYFMKRAL